MFYSMFYSDEPLLCISQDLICDGVRQCPIGGEMFSDEDDQLCENQRGDLHVRILIKLNKKKK